jgi:hypothetical protein
MFYRRGRYYWVKFKWRRKVIRRSTRVSDLETARCIESKIRAALAKSYARAMKVRGDPTVLSLLFNDIRNARRIARPTSGAESVKTRFQKLKIRKQCDREFLDSLGIKDPPEAPK